MCMCVVTRARKRRHQDSELDSLRCSAILSLGLGLVCWCGRRFWCRRGLRRGLRIGYRHNLILSCVGPRVPVVQRVVLLGLERERLQRLRGCLIAGARRAL